MERWSDDGEEERQRDGGWRGGGTEKWRMKRRRVREVEDGGEQRQGTRAGAYAHQGTIYTCIHTHTHTRTRTHKVHVCVHARMPTKIQIFIHKVLYILLSTIVDSLSLSLPLSLDYCRHGTIYTCMYIHHTHIHTQGTRRRAGANAHHHIPSYAPRTHARTRTHTIHATQ
jgi:hypothetical protein